jgi:hypothetical protein
MTSQNGQHDLALEHVVCRYSCNVLLSAGTHVAFCVLIFKSRGIVFLCVKVLSYDQQPLAKSHLFFIFLEILSSFVVSGFFNTLSVAQSSVECKMINES